MFTPVDDVGCGARLELHADDPTTPGAVGVVGRSCPAHFAGEEEFAGAATNVDPEIEQRAGRNGGVGAELDAADGEVDGGTGDRRADEIRVSSRQNDLHDQPVITFEPRVHAFVIAITRRTITQPVAGAIELYHVVVVSCHGSEASVSCLAASQNRARVRVRL